MKCLTWNVASFVPSAVALAGIVMLGTSAAQAQTTAVEPRGTLTLGSTSLSSIGYTFSVLTSINVTQLGFYDVGQDGLAADHAVNIYDSSGGVQVAGTVVNGTANTTLDADGFRYVTLGNSVTLGPGTYCIGAATSSLNGQGAVVSDGYIASSTVAPAGSAQVSYIAGFERDTSGTGLFNPSIGYTSSNTTGYLGPNFKYTVVSSAAPEPGSLALLASCAVPMAGLVLRRRRIVKN